MKEERRFDYLLREHPDYCMCRGCVPNTARAKRWVKKATTRAARRRAKERLGALR